MFGRNKKQKKTIGGESSTKLAIDIGTEYVKTVIYTLNDQGIEIIGYDRTKQDESSMSGAFIINLQHVIDTVDKSIGKSFAAAEQLAQDTLEIPRSAILGIAGELIQGITILVNVDRDNPDKPITQKELDNIVSQIRKQSFDDTKEELAEELGLRSAQITEIDTMVNSVYIDGIKVLNPVGFTGSEIVYRVFSTFAPKIHVDSIKTVSESLDLSVDRVVVQPYALSLAMKGVRDAKSNAIFVDIGGGTTDIAVVQEGDLVGTRMFAIGGRSFTKRIQQVMDCDFQEAEDYKFAYTDSKIDKAKTEVITQALAEDVQTWLVGLQLALEDFEDIEIFPSEIYLCGGGALLPDIQEGLLAHPWLQVLRFHAFPQVNFFFPNKVRNIVDKTKSAKLPMDVTPLALARMLLEN